MEIKKQCFGYAIECPLHISFYYNTDLELCKVSDKCYKMWLELGGVLGLEGIERYGEKAWYENNTTNN